MDNKKSEIIEKINVHLQQFDEIEFAYLFGSYARNEETDLSDIDIAIYQKNTKSKYELKSFELEVEVKLTEKFQNEKFDVRSMNDAPITVIGKIINEGKLLFARDRSFLTDYIVHNRLKYMDYMIIYKPLLEQRYREVING